MATVYLAEDLKHHRKVAVKVLRPELAAVLGAERFVKEIETAANLSNDFAVAAAICAGTDFRNSVTGRASSVTIFMTIACADAPVCGGSPANISYSTHPNE